MAAKTADMEEYYAHVNAEMTKRLFIPVERIVHRMVMRRVRKRFNAMRTVRRKRRPHFARG